MRQKSWNAYSHVRKCSPPFPFEVTRLPKTKDFHRNLESRYRRSQYRDYGGRTWCNVLIALGDVDGLIVSLVNDFVHTRRALATTRGSRRVQEVMMDEPRDIVGLALRCWCELKGVAYS